LCCVRHQQEKFLTTPANQGVATAQPALQDTRGLYQRPIAGLVAEGVVQRLEMIEIDKCDRQGPVLSLGIFPL